MRARYEGRRLNRDGSASITFRVSSPESLYETDALHEGEEYAFRIRRPRRTADQNRLLWKLVGKIAERNCSNVIDTYTDIIRDAGIRVEPVIAPASSIEELRKKYRWAEIIGSAGNGKCVIACYGGTSGYDITEMGMLIDKALEWCANLDIPVRQNDYIIRDGKEAEPEDV